MNLAKGKPMRSFLLAFALVAVWATRFYAQVQQNETVSTFLDSPVPTFEVKDETLPGSIEKLSRGPAPFGLGFEYLLKSRFQDPDPPQPRFSLELHDKTVRQVLDAGCATLPNFAWFEFAGARALRAFRRVGIFRSQFRF